MQIQLETGTLFDCGKSRLWFLAYNNEANLNIV